MDKPKCWVINVIQNFNPTSTFTFNCTFFYPTFGFVHIWPRFGLKQPSILYRVYIPKDSKKHPFVFFYALPPLLSELSKCTSCQTKCQNSTTPPHLSLTPPASTFQTPGIRPALTRGLEQSVSCSPSASAKVCYHRRREAGILLWSFIERITPGYCWSIELSPKEPEPPLRRIILTLFRSS